MPAEGWGERERERKGRDEKERGDSVKPAHSSACPGD